MVPGCHWELKYFCRQMIAHLVFRSCGSVTQIPMKTFLLMEDILLYFINYQNNENTDQHNYFYYKNNKLS